MKIIIRTAKQKLELLEGGSIDIGRAPDNDVLLDSPRVSRKHLRMTHKSGRIQLEDLGSSHGTWINGESILRTVLTEDTEVQLGDELLYVLFQAD